MSARPAFAAAMAALILGGGCDDGSPQQNVRRIEVVGEGGGYVERLRNLSQLNRDLALRRAIQDSGQRCRRILSSAESGRYENMVIWTARCEGGLDWAVFVAPTGDVQVRSCRHVEQLGLPRCSTEGAAQAGSSSVNR